MVFPRAVTQGCIVKANIKVAERYRHFSACAWPFISSRIKENYLKSTYFIPYVRHYSSFFMHIISFDSCNTDDIGDTIPFENTGN